jgi:hypothetical protein
MEASEGKEVMGMVAYWMAGVLTGMSMGLVAFWHKEGLHIFTHGLCGWIVRKGMETAIELLLKYV